MKHIIYTLVIVVSLTCVSKAQWIQIYSDSPAQSCFALKFFDVNTGYHSGVLYNGSNYNIYKTTNGGLNWTAQNSNYTAQRFMAIQILHPDTVYICGNYGKILRTYNGGANWSQIYSDTLLQFWGMKFVNSFTGFVAGSYGSILKTTDRGDNWTVIPSGMLNAFEGMYFLNEITGYISGSLVILKTTNAGDSWFSLNSPYVSGEISTDVYFANESTGWFSTNSGRIVGTQNGGTNWTIVYEQPGTAVWRLSFTDPSTGYGCTSDGKVVKTTNGGTNWFIQNTPLNENLYDINFPVSNTGYIASWSGKILKTTNGGGNTVSILSQENEIPDNIELYQNYPNPFNPVTHLKFSITSNVKGQTSNVKLIVYDALGKKVVTLVDEKISPGNYEIEFDGSDLPSGIYFYKLEAGGFHQVMKMILIK